MLFNLLIFFLTFGSQVFKLTKKMEVHNNRDVVPVSKDNKKLVTGILAILLGYLGIHKFILGYTKEGLILLLSTVLTCGIGAAITSLIGLIEGIIYLTKSDEEFYQTYQIEKRGWF